jgi:hypothetical protein
VSASQGPVIAKLVSGCVLLAISRCVLADVARFLMRAAGRAMPLLSTGCAAI